MKVQLAIILALAWTVPATAITIETVPVGDVGNPNDPATGNLFGGVNYAYSMAKYEVTVGQYTAFLNAIAATDTYAVYDRLMTFAAGAGIQRNGVTGSYAYSVVGPPNLPVTFVGWGDAARFANWIQNGQPTGTQNPGTTEDGAYTLNGAVSQNALLAISRNPNATWFIPSENEWYKAAYYQPASKGGDADGYWKYPMKTNSEPYSSPPPGSTPDNTRVGNFSSAVGGLTNVGAYTSSSSYYGTFDQGGNVYEWNESVMPEPGTISILERVERGSSWQGNVDAMAANFRGVSSTTGGSIFGGFRLASISIPEPTTATLLLLAMLGCGCRHRR